MIDSEDGHWLTKRKSHASARVTSESISHVTEKSITQTFSEPDGS
jgi:hypothetical protein